MEDKNFMMPPILNKGIIRKTEEEVEIIDANVKERGARSDEDWVTYIDSKGNEHIKEHLNVQLDFKAVTNSIFEQFTKLSSFNKMPTVRNNRIFEVAKELILREDLIIKETIKGIVEIATELVDKVGIETE